MYWFSITDYTIEIMYTFNLNNEFIIKKLSALYMFVLYLHTIVYICCTF